ncbi:MAG: cysteine hydrolase family protein [Planctomycetes bacterium]|nr:cysteine hydrolase family protein [Planctomycetota bacterium]
MGSKCFHHPASHAGLVFAVALTLVVTSLFAQDKPSAAEGEREQRPPVAPLAVPSDVQYRPRVPGRLKLRLRSRVEVPAQSGQWRENVREVEWEVAETAIIICDMWDSHYCESAAQRVEEMVPRMNSVITAARNHGVFIVHAPSGTMDAYAETAYRRRMQAAPAAKPPVEIAGWCHLDPSVEPELPIDTSRQPCDDPVVGERVRRFSCQHHGIRIIGYDGVSDSGPEIYNAFHLLGVKNVVLMGVHTNMCVLGRPFGIRQMVRLGFNVVLARDLTDAMYDPREPPYVSHTRGTELVVEHIEKYWCPSIESVDLTKVVAGSADPRAKAVAGAKRPAAAATER